jgi:hypothetical protein
MSVTKKKVQAFFDVGIWPISICFSSCYSHAELTKILQSIKGAERWAIGLEGDEKFFKGCWGCALANVIETDGESETLHYITLNEGFDFRNHYHYCQLAHECLHICQFMLPAFLDVNKEIEAVAYTHTFIMDKCLTILKEARVKNSVL